ncbi:MAG: gliding motility-associated C-terminal domain-containing protein, partial [Flavobacteriales bacterium]|nr:gliding motility-associated C-terminal domain-containing protein [Flavobacteriales bacterium]
ATVTVNVVAAPDAGTPGNSTLCASNTPIDLYSELGGTPDAGGSWSGPSAVIGGMFDPATMIGGIYTYTINVPPPCVNVSSTVTVNVVQAPDAGDDGSTTQCISSPTADLFTALGGSPQSSGTWSGPVPIPGGLFDPASMPPGAYTYTVTGTAPCPDDAAVVIVTVVDIPDPGGPGYAMLCRTDDPLDLFQRLEGSPHPGGSWTTPNGTPFNGTFDPAADPGGVYTYTISVPPPCMSVSATVTVDVVEPPDAGGNATIQLCVSGAPIDLFTILNGTPSANGTWSGPAGVFNGTFDPAVDLAGDHIYTVNGTAPCPAAMAIVTVGLSEASFPGSDATLNLCVSGDPIDLFPALGGADPGGAWTGPNGAFQGPFVPGTDPNGTYVYTLASPTPCPAVSATVNVNVLLDADAGQDGSVTLCSSDGAIDLNNELEGSPDAGGIWLQPSGAPFTGTFDPSMHPAGSYRYVIVVPTPCVNDTALVSVSVVQAVDPGTNGAATLCSNDPPLLLYGELGGAPDIGGTWNGPDGSMEGVFSIGEDTPGAYTYTVPGMAPCPAMSAVVDVAVNTLPDAGSDGTITLCPETAPIQLIDILGGDPMVGGSWTGPGGVPSSGSFDPSTDPPGMYTYTVFGVLPCPDASASATATIFVVAPPDAGPDAVSCDLGYALNATGAWSSGSWSAPVGITFEDASAPTTGVVASSGGAYVLTWSVTSPDGCAAEDTVTVIFTDAIIPIVTVTDAICFAACDGTATVVTNGGNVGTTGYGYEWSGGVAGNVAAASGLCAGTYSIMVLDTNACATTVGFAIDQPVLLVIDRIETTPETCPGSCDGTIVMVDPEGVEYSISGGAPYLPTGTFDGLCPGQYAIAMLDANGCLATGSASIGTPEPVEAGFVFSPDTVFVDDPTVQFTNTSSLNATHFIWDLGGLGTSDAVSPAFTFPGVEGDVYTVCLTAMDVNDCPDTYCAPITVLDILTVHVPNAFTPNDDGFNDGFGPVFNVPWVTDYQFMIFDRWGERIFASEVPEERWDGRYGGEVAKTEVYVWKLQCRDRLSGEFIERMGHVTLLK